MIAMIVPVSQTRENDDRPAGGAQILRRQGAATQMLRIERDRPRPGAKKEPMPETPTYLLQPIGFVRSSLERPEDAPMQGHEGAPDAWVELAPAVAPALDGL